MRRYIRVHYYSLYLLYTRLREKGGTLKACFVYNYFIVIDSYLKARLFVAIFTPPNKYNLRNDGYVHSHASHKLRAEMR